MLAAAVRVPERLSDGHPEVSPPRVPVRDLVRGTPGSDAPAARRVAERDAACHPPAVAIGHAEDSERLGGLEAAEHRRQRAADALGAGRELRTPDRGKDRAAA